MAPMAIGCLVVCLSVRLVHVSQGILQTISSLTIPDWLGCDCAMIIQKINVNMTEELSICNDYCWILTNQWIY